MPLLHYKMYLGLVTQLVTQIFLQGHEINITDYR